MTAPMPVHPAAAVWPPLPADELQTLADDIAENGLIHPVVLTPAREVLDGRNRLAACKLAKVQPKFETHDGDPVAYVLGSNAHRRHISKGQKAMATVLTAQTGLNNLSGKEMAAAVGTTPPMITWARTVAEHAPTLIDRVLAPVEPMALKAAYDEAVKLRDLATGTDARLAKLAKQAPDLAELVRTEVLTLVGAEADVAQRKKERERIGRDGQRAAEEISTSGVNVIAIAGAIQSGFTDIDAAKAEAQLREAADNLADMISAVTR